MGAHDFKARNCQDLGRNIYLGETSQIKKEKGGFPGGSVVTRQYHLNQAVKFGTI